MWLLVYIPAVCLIGLLSWLAYITRHRTGLPGPKGLPILGSGLELAVKPLRDIFPWIEQLFSKYGPVLEINFSGIMTVMIADPDEAEVVMSSINYITKGYEYFVLRPWLREGLILSDGAKWSNRRKLLTPTFHFKILEDNVPSLRKHADKLVKNLLQTNGRPINIDEYIRGSTLDVICETALGIDMGEENKEKHNYVSAIKSITAEASERYRSFWVHNDFLFRLSSLGKSYFKNLSTIHSFSEKVILERKAEYSKKREAKNGPAKKRFAFLDRLLELDSQVPGQLSLRDIQEEVDTFTFAGHDTTSAALQFTLFLLAKHQDVQEKAVTEQFEIFGTDKSPAGMKDLQAMTYLEMVIKESMRYYPPVPLFTRGLKKECRLKNGRVIPPGYNVMIWPWFVHRNEKFWDNPAEFCPERFSPENTRHPFSYIPFSAGARNCLGQKLAMLEMKMTLSGILRSCKLEAETKSFIPILDIITTTEEPILLKVFPRE